jgi:hypothetical protein
MFKTTSYYITTVPAKRRKYNQYFRSSSVSHFPPLEKLTLYIGSNEGCGCSFRHALYDKCQWYFVAWEDESEAVATEGDHQSLVD